MRVAKIAEMRKYRMMLGNRRPLAPREPKTTTEMYFGDGKGPADNDIYFKGAWLVHTLRGLVGADATRAALHAICYPDPALETSTERNACRFVTTDDVCRALRRDV